MQTIFPQNELIEKLHFYSNGELTFNKETPDGIIAYHSPHKRQELVYPTKNLAEVADRMELEWTLKHGKEGCLLRAPEECLCDLSDPFEVRYYGVVNSLATYMMLNDLKSTGKIDELIEESRRSINGLNVYLLEGQAIETQVRIAGNNYKVGQAKENIIKSLKERSEWEKYKNEAISRVKPRELCAREESLDKLKPVTKEFYQKIKNIHEVVSPLYTPSTVCNGIWKSVPTADYYLFIPKTGFKLALGFVDSREKYDDVIFWEYHAGQTNSLPENQMFFKDLENKKVDIIDTSFSGTTLNVMSQKVSEEGGRPIKLAVFPKSRKAIQTSDHFIFLDKMLNPRKVRLDNNWVVDLYSKVINEEI